jgi:hypothetical protein
MGGGVTANVFDDVQTVDPITGDVAVFSNDHVYRYVLTREFGPGPAVVWIGLNPSTADESKDDPTIRRIIGYSRREGFGRLIMLNLYGLRSTDPHGLMAVGDPCGPALVTHALRYCANVDDVVVAWGAWWKQREHALIESPLRKLMVNTATIAEALGRGEARWRIRCLGTTASGEPRHPLYVHRETPMVDWIPPVDLPESIEIGGEA